MEIKQLNDLEVLKAGASSYLCAGYLTSISEFDRLNLFTKLEYERLEAKYNALMLIYEGEAENSWIELFYILMMRFMSDEFNRKNFMEIARLVPTKTIIREKGNPLYVESMLFAASGLLEHHAEASYTAAIKRNSGYLLQKHSIQPMSREVWNFKRTNVETIARKLSQVAEFMASKDLIFDRLLACRKKADVDMLFSVHTSQEWGRYNNEALEGRETKRPKRVKVDAERRNLFGINVVVPLLYAYGYYTQNDELCSQAQELNETLSIERNRYTLGWLSGGVEVHSSFEAQALIQLSSVYCKAKRCAECPVGRLAIRDMSWLDGR